MSSSAEAIDLQAYLARIRYVGRPEPTLDCLTTLVRRHMASIPFEAIDVLLGRGVDPAPATVDRKLLADHRGGYCFEHASLMRRALQAVGFTVTQHLARVWVNGNPRADPPRPATHTSLRVEADGRLWLVDVGFGGFMPNEPLAWVTDTAQHTDFGTFRMTETDSGYLLESRHGEQWLPLYEILDFNWQAADFKIANHYTATHPDSPFRNALMVALTEEDARVTLSGNRFRRVALDGTHEERLLCAQELADVLREVFGLPVEDTWWPLLKQVATGWQ